MTKSTGALLGILSRNMHVQHQVGMAVDWDNLIQVVVVQVHLNKVLDPLVNDRHLVKSHILLDFLLQLE